MADDLSVLFRLRADNAQAKATLTDTRAAIAQLRQTAVSDLKGIQSASTASFGSVTQSISQMTAGIPGVGRAFGSITTQLGSVAEASTAAGTGLAAMAGPIGLAVAGVALLAGGIVTLTKNFFELTKATAAFQGKFFDLSQQVGVSVETLSTLDVIASTTGGNIDSVTASLGIFQKHLEASHDPTSKEAKLLKELGVTSTDVEVALRQAIKGLFDLTDKTKQTDAALQLFGRGGRFVNAILKESHGDLDAATAKFQALGLVLGGEAAAAADQFNDSLEILGRQFDAVTRQLTSRTIPIFIVLFEEINQALTGSKDNWDSWGRIVETTTAAAIAHIKTLAQVIATRGQIDPISAFFIQRDSILASAQAIRASLTVQAAAERAAALALSSGSPGDRPDASKSGADPAAAAQRLAALNLKATLSNINEEQRAIERSLKIRQTQFEEYADAVELTEAQRHLAVVGGLLEEGKAADKLRDSLQRQIQLKEIDTKLTEENNRHKAAQDKLEDERTAENERRQATELALNKQLVAIRDAEREGELARIKEAADRGSLARSIAIAEQIKSEKQAFDDRMALLALEQSQTRTTADRLIAIDNERLESQQRFTDAFKRLTQERLDAMAAEQAKAIELKLPEDFDSDDVPIQDVGEAPEGEGGPGQFGFDVEGFAQDMEESVVPLNELLVDSFNQVADAIGSVVEQWVLYGETGPAVMRKILASALATLAKEATINALKMLAVGFANLAMHDYEAARNAFTSAAIWGAVAGGAALAGRAIAGDSFKQPGDKGGGRGSGRDTELQTIIGGRNQAPDRRITIHLTSDLGELRKVIVGHVVTDYNDGGEIREVIANDGR